jgi:DNA-binding SARP family transcriptional activator/tetratricopeptide (TPR) repeat protein
MLRLHTMGGLWIEEGDGSKNPNVRPRRLALLAVLAAAGRQGVSRDRAMTILWPEQSEERARHALSQTLYKLRLDLGVDVVVADPLRLRLDPERIASDLGDFRDFAARKVWREAIELYAGPFLDGFLLDDAPEFDRWAEVARHDLAESARAALRSLAQATAAAGDAEGAAGYWRRLTALDPLDGQLALSYMEALVAAGQRFRAVAHARAHEALVREELGAAPDPRVITLARRLKEGPVSHPVGTPPARPPEPYAQPTVPSPPAPAPRLGERPPEPALPSGGIPRSRRPRALLAAGAVVVLGTAALAIIRWRGGASAAVPVIAVGAVRDLVSPDSNRSSGVLSDMLTNSLGRLTRIAIVANSRILSLLPPTPQDPAVQRTAAARRAGATEVLEGELSQIGKGDQLRLELRRIDLASGRVRRGYRVAGPDRYAVVDSMTALIASDLRLDAPTGSVAEVSTASPIAYHMYESGLRSYYSRDAQPADAFFRSAIQEDSTFALAAYYAWLTGNAVRAPDAGRFLAMAGELASRAPERDRLLILTRVALVKRDSAGLAYADSLATRYPKDPEALGAAADVYWSVDLNDPRPYAWTNAAIALDSAAGLQQGYCRLCVHLGALALRYAWSDSLVRLERTVDRWIRLAPGEPSAWFARLDLTISTRGWLGARGVLQHLDSMSAAPVGTELMRDLLLGEEFEQAGYICASPATASVRERGELKWLCGILLRNEGRFRDAQRLFFEGRWNGAPVFARDVDSLGVAALYLNWGRALPAELIFEEQARKEAAAHRGKPNEGRTAWIYTLAGTASAAARDTVRLSRLIDSVARYGRTSAWGRDARLHLFLRGLLAAARGRPEEAIGLYRQSVYSWTFGLTRVNYELAQALVAAGRPGEAIDPLRAALHGGVDGGNTYITRTELHEMLARAFAANGQPDSAAAHYRVVARAWAGADEGLRARAESASVNARVIPGARRLSSPGR